MSRSSFDLSSSSSYETLTSITLVSLIDFTINSTIKSITKSSAKSSINSSIFDSHEDFFNIIDTSLRRSFSEKFAIINKNKKKREEEKEKNKKEDKKITNKKKEKNNNERNFSISSRRD